MCYSTGIRYSTKKMRVLGVPCDGLCVCWYSTVWYVLRIELNCVLLEKLKCKITQWSWEELLQLCKWMSEQRFCSIIRFLAEENLFFPIPLIRRSIPVVRGLEWGSARGLQTSGTFIDEFSTWIFFWTSVQNFVFLYNVSGLIKLLQNIAFLSLFQIQSLFCISNIW